MVSVKTDTPKKVKPKKLQNVKIEKVKPPKTLKNVTSKQIVAEAKQQKKEAQSVTGLQNSKKKVKYIMPSKSVTEDLVKKALKALQHLTIHYKKKNSILDDDTPIFVEINCMKIQNSRGNIRFVLPHSTVASTGEVCLITPDIKKGKKTDHEPTVERWEELLRNAGVTAVKTVLPMRQLRVEYDQYELKRRLLTQHDFVMVDTRVLSHVSHVLGQMFFKKHNMLIPVRINEKKSLKDDIEKGLRTVMLRLNIGATSTITVGHVNMPQKQIKENILALVQQLKEKFPGGEANIKSLALKLPLSLSLPLYVTLRPSSSIEAPKLKRDAPKHFTVVEDELSTIPGSTVRVAPDGTVHLKKAACSDDSDMEEDEDNNDKSDKELSEED